MLYITGVPLIVPTVTISDVPYILIWAEPFDNLDPIVSYTVSCSGDVTCPPNFTTTDTTTRSYIITNLIPMTGYTFSVVATNSIGSGGAGVVKITTPSGEKSETRPGIFMLQTGTYVLRLLKLLLTLKSMCLCVCLHIHNYVCQSTKLLCNNCYRKMK